METVIELSSEQVIWPNFLLLAGVLWTVFIAIYCCIKEIEFTTKTAAIAYSPVIAVFIIAAIGAFSSIHKLDNEFRAGLSDAGLIKVNELGRYSDSEFTGIYNGEYMICQNAEVDKATYKVICD